MNKEDDRDSSASANKQLKYKKAIKQISRLISINTSLKKQAITLHQRYDRLSNDHQNLQQKYSTLQFQLTNLKQKHLTGTSNATPNTDQDTNVYDHKTQKLEELQTMLIHKDKQIAELQQSLAQVNHRNVQLEGRLQNIGEEIQQIKVSKQSNIYNDLVQQKCFLEEKLKRSQQKMRRISQEHEMLKKKLSFSEELEAKNNLKDGKTVRDGIELYVERIHRLQKTLELTKQRARNRREKMKQQIKQLYQDNKEKCAKIKQLATFIQKQQNFIQKFVMNSNQND